MQQTRAFVVLCLLILTGVHALAQTREKGPWWPHPIWGGEDQAGASNWITPEKVLEAVRLVETGRIYELGRTYERGMPLFGTRTYSLHVPGAPTYGPWGNNGVVGNDEFLCTQIGQVGTQFDGLGHVGTRMTMADGTEQDVYYNGFTGGEIYGPDGLRRLGIENVKPIITRGILVDLPAYKNLGRLSKDYEVTVEDIRGALARQGIDETSIRPGDAVLFRYGWADLWSEPAKYDDSPPGIGVAAARWVVERKLTMIGADSSGTEVTPDPDSQLVLPVHQELLTRNGIFNLENLDLDELAAAKAYEFLFVFTPVPFTGATGSPGRPLAIR